MCSFLSKLRRKKLFCLLVAIGVMPIIGNTRIVGAGTPEPCRYMQLTAKQAPDPGEGSFLYYASDYHQHEIYASPDVPTMIAFGINNRLPKDKPTPEIRLILDLPEGFEVHGGRFIAKPIETIDIKIENKNYKRFRINLPYYVTRPGATEIMVSTTIRAPKDLKAYYATEIDGKLYHQREIPLYIISIPKVGSPKKIVNWFQPLFGVLDDYPDITAFNKIGFSYPDPEYFIRVIKSGAYSKAKTDFLRFRAEGEGFEKDLDALNVAIFGEKQSGLACPTYRGKNYQALLKRSKGAIDLGVYEHFFDRWEILRQLFHHVLNRTLLFEFFNFIIR